MNSTDWASSAWRQWYPVSFLEIVAS